MLSALNTKDGVLVVGLEIGLLIGFQLVGGLYLLLDCLHP
jgi:hypothetical protein